MIGFVLGLLGGFVVSAVFWWLQAHVIVPELSFSTAVSKLREPTGTHVVYRFKVENTGRRDIIDLSLRARVYLPGVHTLRPTATNTTTIVDIPLNRDHLFALNRNNNVLPHLDLSRVAQEQEGRFAPAILDALSTQADGSLEDLIALSPQGYLVVQALAYDEFSGARKYFASRRYGVEDVMFGFFRELDVIPTAEAVADASAPAEDG